MAFNDEAHHIHEIRSEGEYTEVEWQRSLRKIAETKGSQFVQMDFSATPYNQIGTGQKAKAVYFPHIIADFDLKAAMKSGLVKSLVQCPLSPFNYFVQALARSFDLCQDFLSRCFPDVAFGGEVALAEIAEDCVFEFLDAAETAGQHNILTQITEEALHQIQPRAAGRSEM